MRLRAAWALAVVLCLATTVACGSDNSVGGELDVTSSQDGAGCRLGECTTTSGQVDTSTTEATVARATTATKPTTTAAPTTTTARKPAVFVIKIQSDSAGMQFSPSAARVPRGTIVRWTNADSVERSVEADDGSFRSPLLPPGAFYDLTGAAVGRYAYHDGTRPYAVGTLEIT